MEWELVPVGMHRQNVAEKAIQKFKNHFTSILCGVANDFPMRYWDGLLQQAELTCNLLHQANITSKVFSQAYLFGPHDFSKVPLALMGSAVQIHKKTGKKKTLSVHSSEKWYIRTSLEHFRSLHVIAKETGA